MKKRNVKIITTTIRLPDDLYNWLKAECEKTHIALTRLIENCIRSKKDGK